MAEPCYLSLYLPRFACDWLVRRQPTLRSLPLVTIAKEQGGLTIISASRRAMQAGITESMKLADARAIEPTLEAVDAEPERDRKALEALADWCERYTPLVALDLPHGLMLDISGCAHLFGDEQALGADLIRSLRRIGYEAYAGIATTPGAAWALSRYSTNAQRPLANVARHYTRTILAGLPMPALRISADAETTLQRLGLRLISDLYDIPRSALGKRFGSEVLLRLDQALGDRAEPISPRRTVPVYACKEAFAEAISSAEPIAAVTQRLITTLCERLAEDQRGIRAADLVWWRVDGEVGRISIGTSAPCCTPKHLFRLFAEKLDGIDPGFGIEAMALHATRTDRTAQRQSELTTATDTAVDMAGLVDRLANRLGPDSVQRLTPYQSWMPERAVRPAHIAKPASWPRDRPRPLRMLRRPEPVEAVALLPDDPPVLLRWQGTAHHITHAEGPERIEAEWWHESAPYRDYYRVEDELGHRYWVYRAGAYDQAGQARWYLHGVFA